MRSTQRHLNPRVRQGVLGRTAVALTVVAIVLLGSPDEALAASPVNIVVVGADNVAGRGMGRHGNTGGVSAGEAFPAQLEGLLRAQGVDAHVANAGIAGGMTSDIVARLDASVPDGTQLVILDLARGNDKKRGRLDDEADHVEDIRSRLNARHIRLFVMPRWQRIPGAVENRAADGHHFTAEGHAQIAQFLLPRVMRILREQAQ